MSLVTRFLAPLAIAVPFLFVVACDSAEPTANPGGGSAGSTPDVAATREARARTAGLGNATPTPVPEAARQVALDFAVAHASIEEAWEQFHRDLDSWRAGLIACNSSSVRVSLRQFAGSAAAITGKARRLPRSSTVRGLADQLILAAQKEEEALRLLRDTWPAGPARLRAVEPQGTASESQEQNGAVNNPEENSASSPFEAVDHARADAIAIQKQVSDELSDRLARSSAKTEVALIEKLFQEISRSWDAFHQDYDSLRTEEVQLSSEEMVGRLSELVDQFRAIVVSVRRLPTSESAQRVAQMLGDAAEAEELALRKLRDTFQKSNSSESGSGQSVDEAENGGEQSGQSGSNDTFAPSDPSLFDAFAAQVVHSNGTRRQALLVLADILNEISEQNRAEVLEFKLAQDLLVSEWDSSHQDYESWRRTEGGCDRAAVISALAQLSLEFGGITSDARGLPRATSLRPLGEIYVEAAQREAQALRALRGSWRPFDTEVYRNLDEERNSAQRLRRQVDFGTQELLERYGISSQASGR